MFFARGIAQVDTNLAVVHFAKPTPR
jgi:hypothetical protein